MRKDHQNSKGPWQSRPPRRMQWLKQELREGLSVACPRGGCFPVWLGGLRRPILLTGKPPETQPPRSRADWREEIVDGSERQRCPGWR